MTILNHQLPVVGCRVLCQLPSGSESPARVTRSEIIRNEARVQLFWAGSKETSWVSLNMVRSGFKAGMHVSASGSRETRRFGEGIIVQSNQVAGVDLHLVEFPEHQVKRWLPWQILSLVPSVKQRFFTGQLDAKCTSERARLRILAHLFQHWQQSTGALSNLDIDPLPHQIHLVHHILNSGNYNWLVADDVGLGKTIEAGMLIYALRQRKEARRVLVITPSGLTTQWQEELSSRFGLHDFKIYGRDFTIKKKSHWQDHSHDYVIGSMDQLKQEHHLEMLLHAEPWDLVLVDEAHRLSRRQYGLKLDASERFDLVKELRRRGKIESLILLTATPHQGMQDKFIALLELLRPELREELQLLDLNRDLLGEMVIRNYKSDVTDKEGKFIFQGKATYAVEVPVSEESREFDKSLHSYLRKGYRAGANQGRTGNAIGFVMTVYRKLAASSVAAIHQSLVNRLGRLEREQSEQAGFEHERYEDDRYQGEKEELRVRLISEGEDEFFVGEKEHLEELIRRAQALKKNDLKLKSFMDTILQSTLANSAEERMLVFTEYRTTQSYLAHALAQRFGSAAVHLINGSMSLDERMAAIAAFESTGQYLISTEAGGEGLNLHRQCHIMINYDLPWNPMRLVQRIGRLYRYGQQKRVVILNINSKGTLDEDIISMMYERLSQVVTDMAHVQGDEFNENLKDDILGEVADLASLEEIVEKSQQQDIRRTQQRINDALERAREAANLQRDLFEHVARFDAKTFNEQIVVTDEHLKTFIVGMCRMLEIELDTSFLKGRVWRLRFPKELQKSFNLSRMIHAITFDREIARQREDVEFVSYGSDLFRSFIDIATSIEFGGKLASTSLGVSGKGAILAAMLRWQSDSGRRVREEFSLFLDVGNEIHLNSQEVQRWLLQEANDKQPPAFDKERSRHQFLRLQDLCAQRLSTNMTSSTIPERVDPVSMLWVNPSD
ncbi:MAG: helicase-related protein [Halomonas sp.]|nr:helicase-related protein [Halomonas sp.]